MAPERPSEPLRTITKNTTVSIGVIVLVVGAGYAQYNKTRDLEILVAIGQVKYDDLATRVTGLESKQREQEGVLGKMSENIAVIRSKFDSLTTLPPRK